MFAYKDLDLWLLAPYERDAIRPHVLGKFRDLLEATAKSPAMLFYLDNYLSADPQRIRPPEAPAARTRVRGRAQKLPPIGAKRGLNENYGRELMELHTLGVDGGYTQQDVIEVARAFTGWTISDPRADSEFYFDERLHDPEPQACAGQENSRGGNQGRRTGARSARQKSRTRPVTSRSNWRSTSFPIRRPTRWSSAWPKAFRNRAAICAK